MEPVGRHGASDAPARCIRRLGTVHPGPAGRNALSLRDPQPRHRCRVHAQRPVRARIRSPPGQRERHAGARQPRLARRRLDGPAGAGALAGASDERVRGSRRILAAPPGRPLLQLSRTGRYPAALCVRPGLHAHRIPAADRAPAGRVLGLPERRLFRADQPFRQRGRPEVPCRLLPLRRHRRDPRLGARALPERSVRAGPLRRHRAVRTRRPAPRPAPRLGHLRVQLRA